MQLYILRGENQLGPYSAAEIRQRLGQGTFSPDDLAWGEGMSAWLPVSQLVAAAPPVSPSFTLAEKAALAGAALLFLGAFSPVISVPIVGGITFLKMGWPAYLVLAMATASVITVFRWPLTYLWATGGGTSLVLAGCLANFLYNMHAASAEAEAPRAGQDAFTNLGRTLGSAFLESVQLQWGCFVLGFGAILILAGAFLSGKR